MIEVVVILAAYILLSQKRTIPAASLPLAPGSPLSNDALQQLLGKAGPQPKPPSGGGGLGAPGGGSLGGGGSPSGAGRSAGNFPLPGWDPADPNSRLITPIDYSNPDTYAYLWAYNQYYGQDPQAPTGASGAIGTVPGTGGPGDTGTAEGWIYQDPVLSGVLNAPVGSVTLAPQPDTSGDTWSSAFASDGSGTPSQIDTGGGYYSDPYNDWGSDPGYLSGYGSSEYDGGNGYGGDPYADFL